MKKIIFSTLIMAILFTACNSKSKETAAPETASGTTQNDSQLYACSMHPEVTGKKGDTCSKCGMELTEPIEQTTEKRAEQKTTQAAEATFSINKIVRNYLNLKNALTTDDAKGAANAGKELYAIFNNTDPNSIDAKLKTEYFDIADDAKEHAEHIGANGGNIEHQREHFAMLSKDINDLMKTFKSEQKLYQDFCPMYDGGKGAIWISETKEIKNPYYGSKMLTCGSMKKQF
ncbi:DUF3347 domain-containing protein [Flavobacterium sp. F-65]|uniref:DUF3347 domain-containing protein n=1 Tax=Flavobacterium pisciphilum TaxID=2893755 RepID=A0ABS8MQE1_9FLAO|nr:DUF3347 domain-containing protein [Flavobacterium sp. F-65]MCC9070975.1 DUF3347 domain-containing protein [Flavobacterium sp. F-65]PAM94605.1 cobalt transporter [Flavobacterium sp. IR1]